MHAMRSPMRTRNEDKDVLSPRTTRIILMLTVPLAVVLGVQTISWAVPKVWTSGEPLTAADLNSNFSSLDSAIAALSKPNPWVQCGTLNDLHDKTYCQIDKY